MARWAVKAKTPKLAPGNDPCRGPVLVRRARAGGFTLIELLVVITLIAIASAVASLSIRNPASTRLDHEAARLVALLESARAASRASGIAVTWLPRAAEPNAAEGFRFVGLPTTNDLPTKWLTPEVTADIAGAKAIVLGPEPLIGAQRIVLHLDDQNVALGTDGLGPFVVLDNEQVAQP
jgi:general secretion pathway protein H